MLTDEGRALIRFRCSRCGATYWRTRELDAMCAPGDQRCFECIQSQTYAEGAEWWYLATGIEKSPEFDAGQDVKVRIVWAVFVPAYDAWLCGFRDGTSFAGTARVDRKNFAELSGVNLWHYGGNVS